MKEKTKKYELLKDDFIDWYDGTRLYRIRACKSFGDVERGALGGYIEKESNLSHEGNCWVYKGAKVWGNARVDGDAKIFASSKVYGNAVVQGDAIIADNARVYGNAVVQDSGTVVGDAKVFGFARISNYARISGKARVYDEAKVGDVALVGGNTEVKRKAKVYGNAWIKYSVLTQDIKEDLIQYIACSLNVYPVNGKYILYKRVNKVVPGVYASLFDPQFKYRDGEYVEVKNPDLSFLADCSDGIHVSVPDYWQEGDTLIAVEVNINDIITCMAGKLRCKKVRVIGEVDNERKNKKV